MCKCGQAHRPSECRTCGEPASGHPYYGVLVICYRCKRAAQSYCWHKLQGIERQDILPRYDGSRMGQAYLCILCGYWHWTSNTGVPEEALMECIWGLARYMERTSFHINIARGRAFIRHLPRGDEQAC